MFTIPKPRLFPILAVMILMATLLLSAAPVFAQGSGTAEYAVKHGETLTSIAKRFGLTVDQLLAVNPAITNPNLLRTGQVIILPAGRSEGLPRLDRARVFV